MTETQTPNPDCPQCAGTGFVPPFMDPCVCPPVSAFAKGVPHAAWAETEAGMAEARVGEMSTSLTGGTVVWTGTEWAPVKTEALTAGEYAAKFPKPHRSGDADFDELMDEANAWDAVQQDEAAEAAALAAAAAAVDEVDAEDVSQLDNDPILTSDTVAETEAAAWPVGALLVDGVFVDAETDEPVTVFTGADEPPVDDEMHADGMGVMVASPPYTPKPAGRPITGPQQALLTRLIAERDPTNAAVWNAKARLDSGHLTAKSASTVIDALMAIPADPAKKPARQNSYDGTCRHCGGPVPAMTGVIHKVDGRWQTSHKDGECLTAEAQATLAAERVDEPGLYKWDLSGPPVIYRVRKSRTSSRLYAEKVTVHEHDGVKTVEFAYNAKAISFLRAKDKLTWLEARDFGAAYGACVACGRTLSDPRSLVQQYGSTCAGHYGWPTVTKKQAEAIIDGTVTWEDVVADLGVLTS